VAFIILCGSRKYPYPPQGGLLEILERGVQKAKFFKGKHEPKLEFQRGGGGGEGRGFPNKEKPPEGGEKRRFVLREEREEGVRMRGGGGGVQGAGGFKSKNTPQEGYKYRTDIFWSSTISSLSASENGRPPKLGENAIQKI